MNYDMAGIDDPMRHQKECGIWQEEDCDCMHSKRERAEILFPDWEDDKEGKK